MWTKGNNDDNLQTVSKVFYTPPPKWNSRPPFSPKTWMSEEKKKNTYPSPSKSDPFHVIYKVPSGDSPYIKAKHVQLIEKDPSRAVALFWSAINSGDRVDSALKDMAVVMKQLNRSNEAIEAIKSFRHLCAPDSQESLDNVLVELYKRSGRLEDQIEVLKLKLKRVEEGNSFAGKRVKLARSQGKKVHITVEQEYARLLGNLAWAYLQQNDYKTAEEYYRKALSIEPDRNKQCNLAVCLMCMNRLTEAKFLLQVIRASVPEGQMDESYAKSFERASQLLAEMESQPDKSWSEVEKENCCGNIGFIDSTPNKNPYESVRSNSRKVSDDQLDQTVGAYSCGKSNVGNARNTAAFDPNSSWKRTYTPSVQARGIPTSPFTQPKRSPTLLDSERKTKGTCRNDPVSCLPRRLQFENAAASDVKGTYSETEQRGSVNLLAGRNAPDRTICVAGRNKNLVPTDFSGHKLSTSATGVKTNLSSAEIEGRDSCGPHNEGVFPNCNGKKSWADMVEEDEKEIMHLFSSENVDINTSEHVEESLSREFQSVSVNDNANVAAKQSSACCPLFFNQQQKQDQLKTKRSNRLQVFQDMTPESPRA